MQKQVLDQLLAHGVKNGASDLHFRVGDQPAYRINGSLRAVKMDPLKTTDTEQICLLLMGEAAAPEALKQIQEHDCSYSIQGVARFRVNIYRQR